MAKELFETMLTDDRDVATIVQEKGLAPLADTGELDKVIEGIIANCPDEVKRYRNGKTKLFGFFVGEVMKATKGKADPAVTTRILKEKLG